MIALVLSAAIVVVLDPPLMPACDRPAAYLVEFADGASMAAVSAEYLPAALGIVITPAADGRIYCDGFE